jgi:hypothetical protein
LIALALRAPCTARFSARAARDASRALLQRRGVGARQPDTQLGRDLDVDQAGHAAWPEQSALTARFPDHAGVDDRARLDGLEGIDLHPGGDVAVRLDDALVADDRAFLYPRLAHHVGVLPDDAAPQVDAAAEVDVVVHDRPVQERAFLDDHVAAHDRELAQLGSGLNLCVVADAERAAQHGVRVHLSSLGDPDAG